MLQIDLWKRVVIWGLVALGLLLALPNVFYPRVKDIGQGQQQTKGHEAPDHNTFPQVDLQHYPAFSIGCQRLKGVYPSAGSVFDSTWATVDLTTRTRTPSARSTSISSSSLTLATLPMSPPWVTT